MNTRKAGLDTQILGEEKVPFLHEPLDTTSSPNDPESNDTNHRVRGLRQKFKSGFTPVALLTIVTVLLISNIYLWISLQRQNMAMKSNDSSSPETLYTPANEAIGHKLELVHHYDLNDPFIGPPRPEFDQAWSNLLTPFNIYVTADEMRKGNRQSIKIVSEDDSNEERYLGFIEMYHQLHCIKNLIQSQYPEHYPQLQSKGLLSEEHFNHCTQILRRAIMCHGDIALGTYEWKSNNSFTKDDDDPRPLMSKVGSPHIGGADTDYMRKCIDWNSFDTWARGRMVPPGQDVWGPGKTGYFGPE